MPSAASPSLVLMLMLASHSGCGARTPIEVGEPPPATTSDAGLDAPRPRDAGRDASDAPDAPLGCVVGRTTPRHATADVVFVIDRSGSMAQTIDGREGAAPELWRWSLLDTALTDAVADLEPRIHVGATFFPNRFERMLPGIESPCRTTIGLDIDPAVDGATEMLRVLRTTDPFGGTPTADALAETTRVLSRSRRLRRFVVLATDGAPNCNADLTTPGCVCLVAPSTCEAIGGGTSCLDDSRAIGVVSSTFTEAGIPVYVVGIEDPLRPDLSDVLDAMAIAGGRPRTRPGRRFYSVRSGAELGAALVEISDTISLCGFALDAVPTSDAGLSIELDGVEVPRVTEGGTDGWAWVDRERGEVELLGSACEAARRPGARIEIVITNCS